MGFPVTSPVHFHFDRDGGAIIAARISVWSGVGSANPKREAVVNFDHPVQQHEDVSVVLPQGTLVCVFKCFVRQDLNGRYAFDAFVDDQDVFGGPQSGDVSTEPDKTALLEAQFDIDVA